MASLSELITKESLGILESLSTDDLVIGSPFACPEGRGFEKYTEMVRKGGHENQRAPWWRILK